MWNLLLSVYCEQLLEHDICLVFLFMCHCYCLYYCIFEQNKWRWRISIGSHRHSPTDIFNDLHGPLTRFSRSRHFWSRIAEKRLVLGKIYYCTLIGTIGNIFTMFGDHEWPLDTSRGLSPIAECFVWDIRLITVTLKPGLWVSRGHWNRHGSIQPWAYLVTFPRWMVISIENRKIFPPRVFCALANAVPLGVGYQRC